MADSTATPSDRKTHALVGAVIGATVGFAVGTLIDYESNKKPASERLYTTHFGGILLPPLGAIIGAGVGWHH